MNGLEQTVQDESLGSISVTDANDLGIGLALQDNPEADFTTLESELSPEDPGIITSDSFDGQPPEELGVVDATDTATQAIDDESDLVGNLAYAGKDKPETLPKAEGDFGANFSTARDAIFDALVPTFKSGTTAIDFQEIANTLSSLYANPNSGYTVYGNYGINNPTTGQQTGVQLLIGDFTGDGNGGGLSISISSHAVDLVQLNPAGVPLTKYQQEFTLAPSTIGSQDIYVFWRGPKFTIPAPYFFNGPIFDSLHNPSGPG